jgi:hypothetical protein
LAGFALDVIISAEDSTAHPAPHVAPGQYFLHARVRFARGDIETPKRPLRITL